MEIGEINYNLNMDNRYSVSGISPDAAISRETREQQQEPSGNAAILQAKVGDTIAGEVLNIVGDEVILQLSDNKTLTAHMSEAVNLNIGDLMNFIVQENNGSSVTISPKINQNVNNMSAALQKVLENNNLMPSDRNYQIAESLMNHNMPLDKASMQKVIQQSYRFPDASIDTLVEMNKLGLTVNEGSIGEFENYKAGTHQLMNSVSEFTDSIADFTNQILSEMTETNQLGTNERFEFGSQVLSALSDPGDAANMKILPDGSFIPTENAEISPNALPAEIQNLAQDVLSFLNIPQDSVEALINNSNTTMQLMNNITSMLSDMNQNIPFEAQELNDFFGSESFDLLFKAAVNEKFTLDASKMENPSEIDNLYKGMYEKADKMQQLFAGLGGQAGEKMQQNAGNMQDRLDFIQNLNQMYAYAQLPVRLPDQNLQSELFVYMNKKNIKNAKEAVSALLHLDMDNLGPTDVHVSLHGSVVHTKFYVEDEISARVLDEHMNQLELAIKDSGFTLTNEVIMREPSITAKPNNMAVDELLGKDLEQSMKRYTFDIRT